MAISHPIPVDVLRQLLRLDPETGKLYWRERGPEWFPPNKWNTSESRSRQWNTQFAGKEACITRNDEGYRTGEIFARKYFAQRVVFALWNGCWPTGEVDHKDGDRGNNRPDNLRDVTKSQNQRNAGARGKNKTSPYCGAYWWAHGKRWRAAIQTGGKQVHLGTFRSEIDAARAYDRAAKEWHGEYARLNFPDGE